MRFQFSTYVCIWPVRISAEDPQIIADINIPAMLLGPPVAHVS
jgi:hypothetical protein